MRIYSRVMFLVAVAPLLMTVTANLLNAQDQPLKAVPEVISTRYCYGDAEVFSVWLKLRVKYINRSERTVILDKEIGKAWYGEKVSRTLDDLHAEEYEYNPNVDWFTTGSHPTGNHAAPQNPGNPKQGFFSLN